jgi:hypothetical protein
LVKLEGWRHGSSGRPPLPSKYKTLISNSSTTKKIKNADKPFFY